jgi:hypothetical protein
VEEGAFCITRFCIKERRVWRAVREEEGREER